MNWVVKLGRYPVPDVLCRCAHSTSQSEAQYRANWVGTQYRMYCAGVRTPLRRVKPSTERTGSVCALHFVTHPVPKVLGRECIHPVPEVLGRGDWVTVRMHWVAQPRRLPTQDIRDWVDGVMTGRLGTDAVHSALCCTLQADGVLRNFPLRDGFCYILEPT